MMATPKNKINLDLLKNRTTITRSDRPSRLPERYRQNEHESKYFRQ